MMPGLRKAGRMSTGMCKSETAPATRNRSAATITAWGFVSAKRTNPMRGLDSCPRRVAYDNVSFQYTGEARRRKSRQSAGERRGVSPPVTSRARRYRRAHAAPLARALSFSRKRDAQILAQVVEVLDADAEADEAVVDAA